MKNSRAVNFFHYKTQVYDDEEVTSSQSHEQEEKIKLLKPDGRFLIASSLISIFGFFFMIINLMKAEEEAAKLKQELEDSRAEILCVALVLLIFLGGFIYVWRKGRRLTDENSHQRMEIQRLRAEQADRLDINCIICLDSPREVLINPCGHVCLCHDCSRNIVYDGNKCPICRLNIESVQKAFIS